MHNGRVVMHCNCIDLMAQMDPEEIDSIVTDPPYGIGFMGKDWDHGVPGEPFWAGALRVAKPGAYLLAFGGTRTYHRMACAIEDSGWQIQDCLSWLYGSGFPKHKSKLKPAWEPIVMAWKPDARATHLNIDGCRLTADGLHPVTQGLSTSIYGGGEGLRKERGEYAVPSGRWPANVLLDEEAAAALDARTGERLHGAGYATDNAARGRSPMFGLNGQDSANRYGDSGGASRFFYCAKASRAERDAGLSGMSEKESGVMQDDSYKWTHDGKGNAIKLNTTRANHHPTVKPVALMRWLVRLVTPAGGLVLDPFAGSGTTGVACVHEGFDFIGCERKAEYVEIAQRRIAYAIANRQPELDLGAA